MFSISKLREVSHVHKAKSRGIAISLLCCVAAGLLLQSTRGSAAGTPASLAQWTAPISLGLVPASGAVLSSGKVALWSADNQTTFGGTGHTWTTIFDPATNGSVMRNATESLQAAFCTGTARLSDGRVMINGGLDAGKTSLYDPATNLWGASFGMNIARGYNADTVLSDGSVLTLGGSWSGSNGGKGNAEIFTPSTGWKLLTGVPNSTSFMLNSTYGGWQSDGHYALIPTGNGKVLLAGPTQNMSWINTTGQGSFASAGTRGDDSLAFTGNFVMYDAGLILKVGGSSWNTGGMAATAGAYVIDTTQGTANVTKLSPMAYPRGHVNSVVLPNGQVVVVGGQTNMVEFSDSYAVLAPELWDPQTQKFTVLPAMKVARNYHSIALLLLDGRVLAGGGGLCGCSADHKDVEILSPPYLFNADGTASTRPVITSAPATVNYGGKVSVVTDSSVASFSLVRMSATTHSVNNDQRRVSLGFTATDAQHYQVAIPSNPGILIPGQWMLFGVKANGTPSIAKIVTVSNAAAPVITNTGDMAVMQGVPFNQAVSIFNPSGKLMISAIGLPPGLSIDSATGKISGSATKAGAYVVTISASNGTQTVSTEVLMNVALPTNVGTGLTGQYFANANLSGTVAWTQAGLPSLSLSVGAAPNVNVPSANYSVRWTGLLEGAATGATQFKVVADEGARVWLNGQLIIDRWASANADNGTISLTQAQRYPIMIEYFNGPGASNFQLQWKTPGAAALVQIPLTRFYTIAVPSARNVGLGRVATQSSTYTASIPPPARLAVDGNTDGTFLAGSVTSTASTTAQDWWQVDLGAQTNIDLVQLWNRTDCCANRLTNFKVFVSDTDMTGKTYAQISADPSITQRTLPGTINIAPTIGIPINGAGRYVRIQLIGTNYLSLAEVQVFGGLNKAGSATITSIADQQTDLGVAASVQARGTSTDGTQVVYSAISLPPGVTMNLSSGLMSGTPTTAGTYSVTVTANTISGDASTTFRWNVLAPIPKVTGLTAPVVVTGQTVTYNPTISNGATSTYTWYFSDGTGFYKAAAIAPATHIYKVPGVFTVSLTITASDGRISSYTFLQAVVTPQPATPPSVRSSSNILIAPGVSGATRLCVVNQDNGSLSVFDPTSNQLLAEVAVGIDPRTAAVAPDGRVWVVNKTSATISIVNLSNLTVAQTVKLPVGSQPFGIVFAPAGNLAFVTLEATGQVLKIDAVKTTTLGTLTLGGDIRHVAMNPSGTFLLVSRFITPPVPGESTDWVNSDSGAGGEVVQVDPGTFQGVRTIVLNYSWKADGENSGRGFPNYLGAAAVSPDGKYAWVPSKQDNLKRGGIRDGVALDFKHTVRAISSAINLNTMQEELWNRVDHNLSSFASAALFHPNGAYLFVALESSREVAVIDPQYSQELFRYQVGLAPEGLAVSADGTKLYVNNFMSRTVSVVDLSNLVAGNTTAPKITTVSSVVTEKLTPTVLKGKQLFYDAADPRLSKDRYMSCAVCHNDGGHDGRTWDFTSLGEGVRNTINLRGRAGMGQGFIHWSANMDEIQDFEAQIRNFAGGTGLMADADFLAGTRSQNLGDKKAGISPDLDALAAYITSLNTFAASPYRNQDGTHTAAAIAGKAVFDAQKCSVCHGGAGFTLSGDASKLKDVGTIKPASGKRMNGPLPGIDIPTLRDVWGTAPYLHDGSATTLSDAVSAHKGVALSATDLGNLVQYLKEIDGSEAAPK